MNRLQERLAVSAEGCSGPRKPFRRCYTFVLDCTQIACEYSFSNGRRRRSHVKGIGAGPLASALLPCSVEHDVDEWSARRRILLPKNIRCDLDQKAVQDALVPTGKH